MATGQELLAFFSARSSPGGGFTSPQGNILNLNAGFASKVMALGQKFEATTGQKFRFTSLARTAESQPNGIGQSQTQLHNNYVNGTGGLAAPPGGSYHNFGAAVDISGSQSTGGNDAAVNFMRSNASAFGLNTIANDLGHLQSGAGGISGLNISGPTIGSLIGQGGSTPDSAPAAITQPAASPVDTTQFDGGSGISHGSDAFSTEGGAGFSSGDTLSSGDGSSVGASAPATAAGQATGGTIDTGDAGGPGGETVQGGATGVPGISSQGTGSFLDTSAAPAAPSDASAASASPPANTPSAPADSAGATTNPIQPTAGASSGASAGTAPQGTDKASSGGTPIYETNAAAVGADAANTVSKALGGVTQGAAADTSAAVGAGTGWLNSLFGEGTDILARSGFILLGLFLLLGAFVFFYIDSKGNGPSVEVVPIPA